MEFLVKRDDLREFRTDGEASPPEPADGEAVLAVESFGLTSNNITYGVFGETMNYWEFFPAADGWGHLPVWGFGSVSDSRHPDLGAGMRVYGYFPLASWLTIVPDRINERGFIDGAEHRRPLPSAYQAYREVGGDPAHDPDLEDEQIIFWPLFYTSFLVDDLVDDNDAFGAERIVLSSASSKTAIIAAYLLAQRDGPALTGLTSASNREFVEGLGIYDEVLGYDEISSIEAGPAAYLDFSGNAEVRGDVHEHLGEGLGHSAMIGVTHHDHLAPGGGKLTGPKPEFFFAPDRIRKRGEDWGPAELERRVAESWTPFAKWADGWLKVERISAPEEIEKTYSDLLDGRIDPKAGHIVDVK